MRNLTKAVEPEVLARNHVVWLSQYKADKSNATNKTRYRERNIKETLKKETGYKCVYCESKIGHNTPGDIEHKVPSSKDEDQHFIWFNLTIACSECNRRKNNYYEIGNEFLDPYSDNVETALEHYGPLVFWKSANERAETTIRILQLNGNDRQQLIERKIKKLEDFSNLIERFLVQTGMLKMLLWQQILEMIDLSSEYSAMLQEVIQKKGITSASAGS
ncbi:HNH endonuclease [Porticoccaceae bacterium]|nr:HNH endonuclease [Porticoccaceae bacterium]